MLGDGVGRGADVGEEPGRRAGLEQRPAAAGEHAGQHGARRVDVRHEVHLPGELPVGVGRVLVPADRDAGVRAEEVHAPVLLLDGADQLGDLWLVANVDGTRPPADGVGDLLGARRVAVEDPQRPRLLDGEPLAHRLADARRPAGDDDDLDP